MLISELKQTLIDGRDEIRSAHDAQRTAGERTVAARSRCAAEIGQALTALCDHIIEELYRPALEELSSESRSLVSNGLSLIALGGYGRRDLAPYSDIDLLFLADPACEDHPVVREFVSRLVRDLWDVGLKLSQSVRSTAGCIAAAKQDLTCRTALTEARLLIGNQQEFTVLQSRVRRSLQSAPINRLVDSILSERSREHYDYHAQTVLLLEPNLKKSPGGLRDMHMMRWIALARYGEQSLDGLQATGAIRSDDLATLNEGQAFLQYLRHEMHFQAGSAQDVLTRDEQIRLAGWLEFRDEAGLLGVERFMREYYRRTGAIHEVVMRFIENARKRPVLDRLIRHVASSRVEKHFLRTRHTLTIAADSMDVVLGDPELILQLFDCARGYGVTVDHEIVERIRSLNGILVITPEARRRFLAMLDNPPGLSHLIRALHKVNLLCRLLPPFEHARGLIQFNLYHRYTIDEHTLRALEAAVRRRDEHSPLAQAYREIRDKSLLHLAVLLHDLGKGFERDHCEVGGELAADVARDFGLNDRQTHTLAWLVQNHLLMAHTAFRRDLADEATLVQFARAVATPEMLRMLYVLTAADTEAVSPENWTGWKESLLNELYFRAAEELTGEAPTANAEERARKARAELVCELRGQFPASCLDQQLGLMPLSYLQGTPASTVARHLHMIERLADRPVQVDSEYQPATNFVEYTVCTRDDLTEGIFSKIAGVLAAGGFQIVSATIVTRPDKVIIDTFSGQDVTFAGPPPASRRRELADQIEAVLLGKLRIEDLLARRRIPISPSGNGGLCVPPQVEIDNTTSDRFTIVEVFAEDKLGRLYTITRQMFDLGLSIHSAKISTHADQIVDAFYVTDRQGKKLEDGSYLEHVRLQLLNTMECV